MEARLGSPQPPGQYVGSFSPPGTLLEELAPDHAHCVPSWSPARRQARKKTENEGVSSCRGCSEGKVRFPRALREARGAAPKPGRRSSPAPSRGRTGAAGLPHRGGAPPGRALPSLRLGFALGSSRPVPRDTGPPPELKTPPSLLPRCPAQPRTIRRQALAQRRARADPGLPPGSRGTPGGRPGTSLNTVIRLGARSPDCPAFPGPDLQGPAGSSRRPGPLRSPSGCNTGPQARGGGRVAGGQVLLPPPRPLRGRP